MSDSKRLIRPALWILMIAITVFGLNNVYGDNTELISQAETIACGKEHCSVKMVRQERTPFSQSFSFQVDARDGRTIDVKCTRSALLVGEYGCQ